ncbi:ABC transporter substrate-binding protein [Quisquiliibacterium transsilvanicum]|uniref:Branched-chain amino acid transport system substrate-binding protein n=1 Tax=Quisquiliibacterium transsilvanicum TaxID=1549638 RepID=A0A7W8M714_9BURK|nr:ABC transporter substrate-binding protein [Quisquiliibacterium transsilvanicum]MBB5270253.1 branched-chain amino acid transport system substrate-binding protein [Quisquiliibacterium transsilvanicum]
MTKRTFTAAVFAPALMAAFAGQALAADVVRIGVLTDMTGVLSDTLGMGSVEGARLAVEEFGGKVLGKNIEVVHADHQNKADIGANAARKWIDADGVGAILDLGNSAVAIAVQNIVKEKNRVSISAGAASSELTNKYCNANSFHWGYDSYQFAKASTSELVKSGADTWFFITADYAFGHGLENDTRKAVEAAGGKVLGAVRHPANNMDFSSHLLQAQASKAKVIGLATAVADLQTAIKQGTEFKVFGEKTRASAMAMLLVDVHSVGLKAAQGTVLSSVFYWDADEGSRAFAKKFSAKMGRPPTEAHAMTYSATLHYLKAIRAAGTEDTAAVIAKMRELPVQDSVTQGQAKLRADGRLMRDVWLVRVKKPEESSKPWDYFHVLNPIKAENAFRPVAESECALLKK